MQLDSLRCMTELAGIDQGAGSEAVVSPPPGERGGDPRSRRTVIFVVTALGAFMASLDLSIVNVAFPALERSFPHDSRAALAWVITG